MRLAPLLVLAGLTGFAGLAVPAGPARAESAPSQVVQNDGYFGGPEVAFPSGLKKGDAVAARLTGFGGNTAVIQVTVVFGGGGPASTQVPVTLKIWDDTSLTDAPGPELFSSSEVLVNTATPTFQILPLAGVGVGERFRVGFVLGADAPPMVGHDADGNMQPGVNFTFRPTTGWSRSQADGVTGDWIIRATLASGGNGGGGSNGGGACFGVDCPAGQFCDTASRACTFECRTADDCGGAFCNSNGQCVGEGGGCCETGGGGAPAAGMLALGVLALVLRRRR